MGTQTIADRYSVTGRIGAGGGGVVWRATDDVLGRTVAVKEVSLPTHLSEDARDRVRRRAMREARSAARLEHPSVVSIFDVLQGDDALFIVMEHIDAPSLAQRLSQHGPLGPHETATIGLAVLDALDAAHEAGVVHRDVKPSNVLVPPNAPPVVTDFGIAAVHGKTGITRTGDALGTPDYISPEQLEDGPVGPPTDLWSLGATLYHAVEGVPPFQRERTMATIRGVAEAEPRPCARAGPLQEPVLRLLTKDPADRPDAPEVRELLVAARTAATSTTTQSVTDVEHEDGGDARDDDRGDADRATAPTSSPTAAPTRQRTSRRRAAVVLGGIVLVGGLAAGVLLTSGQPGGPTEQSASSAQEGSDADGARTGVGATDAPSDASGDAREQADGDEQPAQGGGQQAQAQGTDASGTEPAPPPDGWRLYEGDGFGVAVPSAWQREDAPGSAVQLTAPSGDVYLRAAHTDDPADDVLADTRRIRDSFRSRHPSYEQVSLEPVEYRGHEAVRWEYTYAPDGRPLRAVHLNFSTGERGYALNYQTPADAWEDLAPRFDDFTSTFRES